MGLEMPSMGARGGPPATRKSIHYFRLSPRGIQAGRLGPSELATPSREIRKQRKVEY
jgi:hypothetical protein